MKTKGLELAVGTVSAESTLGEGIVSSWIDPLFIPKVLNTVVSGYYDMAERGLAGVGYFTGLGLIGNYIAEDPTDLSRYLPVAMNVGSLISQKLFNNN